MDFKFVILIVLLLILIYFICPPNIKDPYVLSPDKLYKKSIGVADGPALEALEKLESKKNKTVAEEFQIANIISNNILEAETPLNKTTFKAAKQYYKAVEVAAEPINVALPELGHLLDTADDFNNRLAADEFMAIQRVLAENINTTRVAHALAIREESKNPLEYLEKSVKHTNDLQNAHDNNVNSEIKKSLDIIETEIGPLKFDINEVKLFIREFPDEKIKAKAKYSLHIIETKNEFISSAKRTELEILGLVWLRSYYEGNNKENIQEAIIYALADISSRNGWNEDYIVCANGRASRIVAALSALDVNPEVGKIQTKEQVRNYIFESAAHILKEELKKYNGEPKNDEELNTFKVALKEKIDAMLDANSAAPDIRRDVYIGLEY